MEPNNNPAFPINEDPVPPVPADDPSQPAQPLPQDNETPFSPPTDVPEDNLPQDHPVTDTNVQAEEVYDEGLSGATEASDPEQGEPPQ